MQIVMIIVFLGAFAVVALLFVAGGAGASQQTKKTLATLQSALATSKQGESVDQLVDLRKQELLSAIPWINRQLLKIELAPRLRIMLYQANLKWTAGGLMLISSIAFLIVGYLLYLRTGHTVISI